MRATRSSAAQLRLALYDISAERLAHAERLARRISEQSGAGATVTATLDRREALARRPAT